MDVSGKMWNEVILAPPAVTKSIRIEVLTVYSSSKNGFVEIEFYKAGKLDSLTSKGNISKCLYMYMSLRQRDIHAHARAHKNTHTSRRTYAVIAIVIFIQN